MTYNEDFERKMAFIVDQQAQFAVGIQELRDLHAESEKARALSESIVARLSYATLEGFKDTKVKIDALVDSQIRGEDALSRIEESLERADSIS